MKHDIRTHPIHLGLGATAQAQPEFNGMEWYVAYGERTAAVGHEGRLVSMHTFSSPWDVWEMHPNGSEVVLCVNGELTLIQEIEGKDVPVKLSAGEYAINEAGVWHTADAAASATAVFITSGVGTEHRPR